MNQGRYRALYLLINLAEYNTTLYALLSFSLQWVPQSLTHLKIIFTKHVIIYHIIIRDIALSFSIPLACGQRDAEWFALFLILKANL